MNPETNRFERVPKVVANNDPRAQWAQFRVGDEVEINGVLFAIRKITPKDLVLRPK